MNDYRNMGKVKIVPDDCSDVYMYLVIGIAIGFIIAKIAL